jgi:flavodoxin
MNVLVVYESRTGNTRRAALLMADAFEAAGHTTTVCPTMDVDLKVAADADLVVVGTWTDGLVLFGHRPGGAGHLVKGLPTLWDKPTYAFVTYAIRPGGVLRKLNALLASKGADVKGALELHRRHLETDAPDFVDGVLQSVAAAAR